MRPEDEERFVAFTTLSKGPDSASGTVYVDSRGRVRRLVTDTRMPLFDGTADGITEDSTTDMTFDGFGVPVPVTVPPASQVHNLGKHPLIIDMPR
jgi:hypothetical protein